MNKISLSVCLASLVSSGVGCAVEDNLSLAIGHHAVLDGFPPVVPGAQDGLVGSSDRSAIPGDGPSVTGLDRSGMVRTEFLVPIDGVYHQPHATMPLNLLDSQARQRGEFPTPETIFEQQDASLLDSIGELLAIPAWSVVEAVWLVPAIVVEAPWSTVSSPSRLTGRTSAPAPVIAPGILPLTEAELEDLRRATEIDQSPADDGAS
ncbi:MAG TPA: hypothetical protein ENJ00_07065 [Phycisphaerales bacterium]|nr:hypothetical protein [Phycisphaerales bacterium]